MQLARLAFLDLQPPIRREELFHAIGVGDITVSTDAVWEDAEGNVAAHLIAAAISLQKYPERDDNGTITLPVRAIRDAERAIEHVANLVAVAIRRARRLSSPRLLSVVLIPESDNDRDWLARSGGAITSLTPVVAVTRHHEFDLNSTNVNALADRLDGVLLVAEALSHQHATGRFHDLFRVLERAFALGPGRLVKPLQQFLLDAPYDFTEAEVQRWSELRGPVTHADRRSTFLVEGDVLPIVDRLEFAAYDILLHKEEWRSASPTRRHLDSRDIAGENATARLQNLTRSYTLIDPFGAWPVHLTAPEVQSRPEWWVPPLKPNNLAVMDAFVTPMTDRY